MSKGVAASLPTPGSSEGPQQLSRPHTATPSRMQRPAPRLKDATKEPPALISLHACCFLPSHQPACLPAPHQPSPAPACRPPNPPGCPHAPQPHGGTPHPAPARCKSKVHMHAQILNVGCVHSQQTVQVSLPVQHRCPTAHPNPKARTSSADLTLQPNRRRELRQQSQGRTRHRCTCAPRGQAPSAADAHSLGGGGDAPQPPARCATVVGRGERGYL